MTVRIRQARKRDYEAIEAISREGAAFHMAGEPGIFTVPDDMPTLFKTRFRGLIEDPEAAVFVAVVKQEIAGHLIVQVNETYHPVFIPTLELWIDEVIVAKAYQRQGIGRALMEHAQRWGQELGATRVRLNVWRFNEGAIRLYENMGYETRALKMYKMLGEED